MAGKFKLPAVSPWAWVRLILVAAMLYWVVERSGRGRILQVLASANPAWTLAAALCFFLSILAGAYQWHLLLKLAGIGYGYGACFRSYYSGLFLNNFLPGTVGGDALRVWDVHRSEATGVGKAAAATLLDRLLGFSALAFLSLLALAYELQKNQLPQSLLHRLLWTVGLVSLGFLLVLLPLLSRRISRALHAVIRMVGLRKLDTAYVKIQNSLEAYKTRWASMGYMFVLACLVQFLRVAVHAFSAWALHLSLAPTLFFSFVPLIALVAVLPLNVGGWGLPQGLGAYLYALPGVFAMSANAGFDVRSAAAALAFLPTVIGMVVMLGGGFYFVFRSSASPRNKT